MIAQELAFEQIVIQVQQLPPSDQLRLITYMTERLMGYMRSRTSQPLIYGQFPGKRLSTEEDFAIAEWHPTESELHG